jgi:hypothetical protein
MIMWILIAKSTSNTQPEVEDLEAGSMGEELSAPVP